MTYMTKIKRKIIMCICFGFLIVFFLAVWGLTSWKAEDLQESMYNDFMNAYDLLYIKSNEDDFLENPQTYLNEFSSELAKRNIYAAAVILNTQGDVLVKSDVSDIIFNGRTDNAVDLNRFADCIYDAQDSVNDENFPKGEKDIGFSSAGPTGYTQGWTLNKNNTNSGYIFINAKFFEGELAIKTMIPRYLQIFIILGIICFFLCFIVSRIVKEEISRDPNEVMDISAYDEQ
ncbi:MAG: hypothetical protein EOM05_02630 [Clostridia bacterium]|nr:hypothetical protein [Clostridia bacterium]